MIFFKSNRKISWGILFFSIFLFPFSSASGAENGLGGVGNTSGSALGGGGNPAGGLGGSGNPPASRSNSTTFENPLKFDSLTEFMIAFLDVIITIAFPFLILAVIYTGFLFVKAQGNPEELKTAKTAFLWTVIGALIILAAQAISILIQGTVTQITG